MERYECGRSRSERHFPDANVCCLSRWQRRVGVGGGKQQTLLADRLANRVLPDLQGYLWPVVVREHAELILGRRVDLVIHQHSSRGLHNGLVDYAAQDRGQHLINLPEWQANFKRHIDYSYQVRSYIAGRFFDWKSVAETL